MGASSNAPGHFLAEVIEIDTGDGPFALTIIHNVLMGEIEGVGVLEIPSRESMRHPQRQELNAVVDLAANLAGREQRFEKTQVRITFVYSAMRCRRRDTPAENCR